MIHSIHYSSFNNYAQQTLPATERSTGNVMNSGTGSTLPVAQQPPTQADSQRTGQQQQMAPSSTQGAQASLPAAALTSAEVALLLPYIQNGLVSPDILAPNVKSGTDLSMLSGQWADEDRMAMGALNTAMYKNYFHAKRYDNHYTNTKRADWVLGNTAKKNSLNAFRSDVVWDAETGKFLSTPKRAVDAVGKDGLHKRNAQTGGLERTPVEGTTVKNPKEIKNALVREESFRYGDEFELRAKSNKSNTEGFRRRTANWAYDNDNMHAAEYGKTGSVTASLEKHGKNTVELQKLREMKAPADKKMAKHTQVATNAKSFQEFSNVRTRMAGAEMRHLQHTVQQMEQQLSGLKEGAKKTKLQGELKLAQQRLNLQQQHFAKLHRQNTKTQVNQLKEVEGKPSKVHSAQQFAEDVRSTKANWFDRLLNPGKDAETVTKLKQADKATAFAQQHGLKPEDVINIVETSGEGVADQLTEAIKQNATQAAELSKAAQAGSLTTNQLGQLDEVADLGMKAASTQNLGAMAKLAKVAAPIAIALEGLNFANNYRNGDHRKAFTDLTSSLVTGLASAAIVGTMISPVGWGVLAYMGATMAIGMVANSVATPLIDKGIKGANQWMHKTMGFPLIENRNEREARLAKEELAKLQNTLAKA